MRDDVSNILVTVITVPVLFLLALSFAWIPMLGWNRGLHSVFPNIPHISYWQAFWLSVLSGWIIHRPTIYSNKPTA